MSIDLIRIGAYDLDMAYHCALELAGAVAYGSDKSNQDCLAALVDLLTRFRQFPPNIPVVSSNLSWVYLDRSTDSARAGSMAYPKLSHQSQALKFMADAIGKLRFCRWSLGHEVQVEIRYP